MRNNHKQGMNNLVATSRNLRCDGPVRRRIRDMSIKHKLVLVTMVTSVAALVMVAVGIIAWEWTVLRHSAVHVLSMQAQIIAGHSKPDDAENAGQTLQALRADPSIVSACTIDKNGRCFGHYNRDGGPQMDRPASLADNGYLFEGGLLVVSRDVVLDGEAVGCVLLWSDLGPTRSMLKRNVSIVMAALLGASIAAYFICSRLQVIISGPILGLADVAKVVSEKRDYATRALRYANDEIGSLITAFNDMLEQIQQRDLALVRTNEELEQRVQQRTADLTDEIAVRKKAEDSLERLNRQLKAAVDRLSAANRELADFAHIAAHDLKAPLRAIGTLADWLKTDYADKLDEQGREKIGLIAQRAGRMSRYIDSILQYSEIGRVTREKERVDLNSIVRQAIEDLNPPAHIDITVNRLLPAVLCERIRMLQIFENLLGNAVKFMDKAQGHIGIDCVEEDGFWKFSVSDNGPGIEEKYFEKIFVMFQTLVPRDKTEGTGIGLSLVKKIVNSYGGKIWVESQPGCGSTFFFTLPMMPAAAAESRQPCELASRA